ncbi:MAG: MBL fold metallo-hydrolase [Candidatus Margulisiibacteriota bacterium]|nr:MAG: hypothetical protein A2X43_12250 [Candidatus Margulisbacteria bacterium GWD2_39_127]OGI03225.1 MAG: hypothetical protein A2X42_11490 [Candidatus Margulisbacteria bacterium GWF2_38_17]PZM78533.1 MAG: MBL fold metallo-hydrolase [Candidatus Margulisiibacteriota bacterium]HAR63901.1 MBL fold metallo-hydrolase [Candidatus Margulisiibacteriota bacterium]HCY37647.1 MBL fold metallo-hydrolase [Candidatus Margulisiibacteriota bacterium]
MMNTLELIFLGSGTSQGVPMVGCHCPVCVSADPKDNRTNASLLIKVNRKNILIDCGKDFRYQAIRHDLETVDSVLLTHNHFDHIAGLDELRVYNKKQGAPIPVYGKQEHLENLKQFTFNYLFSPCIQKGGGISELNLVAIETSIELEEIVFEPLKVNHGILEIYGYKFLNCAYISDVSSIPEETMDRLYDLDLLIIDVLRFRPHSTHINLRQGLEIINRIKPKQTYFTHICHDFSHQAVENMLRDPSNEYFSQYAVNLSYDGLKIVM